jgi:predicted transcriptional regulator
MSEVRDRIAGHVGKHPGIHFNALVRALDLAPGQTQYHLKRLRSTGTIVAEPLYGRTHYYAPEYDDWERGALALLRRETAADVLTVLLARGPSPPGAVADKLDIARSTLEWHLDRLVERGLVGKHRDLDGRVTLVLARPDDTARLLSLVTSSLPERLLDRYTRLVDRLLAE